MKNTDFMNLSLPEGADKIDVEIINNDFKKLENEASKHYIKQQIEVDGTATIIGSIGPYVQLENLTDNILNVSIGDELVVLMKGDNRKIRTISGENYGVVTNGAVRITYYINAQTYADENFYKKEKVDELLQNVEATVEVDAELSETSENPVQNKVITAELASYATTAEVESKVTEKVAEIVAGAPEDFDTLKEMSDWLAEHEDSAASMNSAIQKNAEDIETANENIEKKLNKKAKCVNGADYDSFVTTGFYEALGGTETPTKNSPNGNDTSNNFYIIVQQRAASYVSQFAISVRNDAGVYVRTMSNSTWNAWRKLLDNTTEYAKSEDLSTANTNISKNTADIATANTNIQKNVDDIKSAKNSIAINKTTLGVQCKNLFKLKQNAGYTQTVSGVSYTFNDDGSITASGTLTGEAALNFSEIYLEAGEYRISSSKFFNAQIYKSSGYVGGYQAIPDGKVITISESGIYSFRWYWGAAGAVVNGTIYPMLTYAEITDVTYEPFKNNDFNIRVSALETLSDVVYKHNNSSHCNIDGYVLRVGNQLHLNLTATFHSACDAWWGGVLNFPFKVKTPDNSARYTIKQTQSDGRETSVYISNGSNSIYTSTAFQKDDVITFPPMILDMYVEEEATTEGGE